MSSNSKDWKDILDLHFDKRARDFLHTSFPAKITRVVNSNVVDVQPLITTLRPDGSVKPYPEIYDVRLHTYSCQRGGVFVSLPIAVGDNVWVFVSERDVALLMQSDGKSAKNSTTERTHDLSDCFAIPAFYPDGNLQQYDPDNLVIANDEVRIEVRGGSVEVKGSLNVTSNLTSGTGASGTFTTATGQVVTVVGGIITNIF